MCLHPEEIFNVSISLAAKSALRFVKISYFILQQLSYFSSSFPVFAQVEFLYFLFDNPIGHRVDVVTEDTTPHPIRLKKRSPSSHEGVGDLYACQVVRLVESLFESAGYKFG